jgi:hypothetical protein
VDFSLFDPNFSLFDPIASLETLEKGEFFEPAITRDDALDTSRTGLWRAVLNDRQSKRLLVGERPAVEIVQYPFLATLGLSRRLQPQDSAGRP